MKVWVGIWSTLVISISIAPFWWQKNLIYKEFQGYAVGTPWIYHESFTCAKWLWRIWYYNYMCKQPPMKCPGGLRVGDFKTYNYFKTYDYFLEKSRICSTAREIVNAVGIDPTKQQQAQRPVDEYLSHRVCSFLSQTLLLHYSYSQISLEKRASPNQLVFWIYGWSGKNINWGKTAYRKTFVIWLKRLADQAHGRKTFVSWLNRQPSSWTL